MNWDMITPDAIVVEVIGAIIALPIIALLKNVYRRLGFGSSLSAESQPLVDKIEVLGYAALMMSLLGAILISVGTTHAFHSIQDPLSLSLGFLFASWALYVLVSGAFGYLALLDIIWINLTTLESLHFGLVDPPEVVTK